MTTFETPNLDAMDADDIREFSQTIDSLDVPQTVKSRLKVYSCLKITAIESRISGDIGRAIANEKACDKIYGTLPGEYQW